MTEYWAYRYFEDPKLANEIEDEGFSEDDILAQWEAEAESADTEPPAGPDDWETL